MASKETNNENYSNTLFRMKFDSDFRFHCGDGNNLQSDVMYHPNSRGWLLLHRWKGDRFPIRYFSPVVGVTKRPSTQVRSFTNMQPDADSVYWHLTEKVSALGTWVFNEPDKVQISLTDTSGYTDTFPPPPTSIRAINDYDEGRVILSWVYMPSIEDNKAVSFNIYSNNGSGDIDLNTIVDTVNRTDITQLYEWNSEVLAEGEYAYTVRSITAAGVESAIPKMGSGFKGVIGSIDAAGEATAAIIVVDRTPPEIPEGPKQV